MREDSRTDIGRFVGLDQKRSGTEHTRTNRMENRIESLRTRCSTPAKADTPVFRASSALERGDLKSKGIGKLSIHFCGDDKTVEVVLRTISSVNHLSIYGAVADMCDDLACRMSDCSERTGKLVAQDKSRNYGCSYRLDDNEQIATDRCETVEGNVLENYEQKFENLPYHVQWTKL